MSEVLLSNVDLTDRFDSEYFEKDDLEIEQKLRAVGSPELRQFGEFVASAFYPAATQLYEFGDTPFIRCVDCINFPLITREQDDLFEKIPFDFVSSNKGINLLSRGDLVISKVGSPSYASLVFEHETVALSRTVLGIKDIEGINRYYLLAFLRSKYGFSQLQRARELTIQYQLTLERVKRTLVFLPTSKFQDEIESLVLSFIERINKSKRLYSQAETLLLDALNLTNFSPSTDNTNTKSFRESFIASGRLDAEYYKPKFDELEAKIAESHELVSLGSIVTLNQRGTQPDYVEEGLPVINSKHVREGEVVLSDNRLANVPDKEEPLLIQKGDVLINGTGVGTIGRSAPYLHEQNALPDNHVTILRTDKLNPIFLSVYLNSIAGKYQVDKYFKGSSGQIELYPKDIDCFYVPLVDDAIQTEIAALVQQSFTLKAESERLLDIAKRAVEIAIEQDEKAAMAFIEANT